RGAPAPASAGRGGRRWRRRSRRSRDDEWDGTSGSPSTMQDAYMYDGCILHTWVLGCQGGGMVTRTAGSPATLRHGANVLRALANTLASVAANGVEAPLDHPSARDAVTLLGWRGECTS